MWRRLKPVVRDRVVWNTGIFGVGTNQAHAAFEMFAPVLKPHLTIYGFYVNDFFDNLFPVDGYFLGINENGDVVTLQKYHLDPWGNVTKLETQSLLYYRWHGVEAPANEFERLLGSTRLGSVSHQRNRPAWQAAGNRANVAFWAPG